MVRALHHGKHKDAGDQPAAHEWRENAGLIVIAVLILAVTITRYWHNIQWSAR